MTTLLDRPGTALLVIDVQNEVIAEAHQRDEVVANIARIVDRARAAGVPVVWTQHSDDHIERGSEGWRHVPELLPLDLETVVHKSYTDSFEDTELEDALARARVGSLVVTGAETDACIRSTIHSALVRGYDVTLVGDGHTTNDQSVWGAPPPDQVIAHTNLYWRYERAPGRTTAVADANDVTFTPDL